MRAYIVPLRSVVNDFVTSKEWLSTVVRNYGDGIQGDQAAGAKRFFSIFPDAKPSKFASATLLNIRHRIYEQEY